jgi:hypothetical protein
VNTSRVIILFIPVGNLADITEQTLLDRFTKRSFDATSHKPRQSHLNDSQSALSGRLSKYSLINLL